MKSKLVNKKFLLFIHCCCKTAVCNGDQLLDFFVLELIPSQVTFSTDPEVPIQNCAVMGFTPCMLCAVLCVYWIISC